MKVKNEKRRRFSFSSVIMRSPTYQHKIVFNKEMRVEISEKGYSVILDEFDEVPTESFDVRGYP